MKPRLLILSLLAFTLKWLPLVSTNTCLFTTCESLRRSLTLTGFNVIYGLFGDEVTITCGLTEFTTVDNWTLTTRQGNRDMESVILRTNKDLAVTNLNASNAGLYTCKRGTTSLHSGCILVLKRAMFASCSVPMTPGTYTCDESSRPLMAVENGSVTLDTRVVYEANEGGPCGFTESVMRVALFKVGNPNSMNLFFCFISGQSVNDPNVSCDDSGVERRIVQTSQPVNRDNVLDFNLIYHNLTLSDSGLYRYTIDLEHLAVTKLTRTLVKEFTINVTVPTPTTTTPEPTTSSSNTTSMESSATETRNTSIAPIVVPIVVIIAIVITVVIIVIIAVIVLKHSAWTGRQGTVSFKGQLKEASNDIDYTQADGLIVNTSNNSFLRPPLDSKGRPLSYIDNFPGTLNEVRDSAPADI